MKNEFHSAPDKNEVRNREEVIKKLKKDRAKIKQESVNFARKVEVNSNKTKYK